MLERSARQILQLSGEIGLSATEARDHRLQEPRRVELVEIERMTRLARQEQQEAELCPAIPVAKGMNGVEFGEK